MKIGVVESNSPLLAAFSFRQAMGPGSSAVAPYLFMSMYSSRVCRAADGSFLLAAAFNSGVNGNSVIGYEFF